MVCFRYLLYGELLTGIIHGFFKYLHSWDHKLFKGFAGCMRCILMVIKHIRVSRANQAQVERMLTPHADWTYLVVPLIVLVFALLLLLMQHL